MLFSILTTQEVLLGIFVILDIVLPESGPAQTGAIVYRDRLSARGAKSQTSGQAGSGGAAEEGYGGSHRGEG